MFGECTCEHLWPLHAVVAAEDIFFPAELSATVSAEKVSFVRWEVLEPKIVVALRKLTGIETFCIGLTRAIDDAGTPTCVQKLPFAIVDLHRVPSMVHVERRERLPGCKGGVSISFPVPRDDK